MSDRVSHEPGGLVPGFDLGAAIGKGGFATVYRARQASLDRDVAIKIDSRVLDDERNRRRFLREATASALISSHPHVVSLIDAGTTRDNRPYLVMELCDNGSVGQLVKRSGPMPPPDVLELGIAISSALAAAHEKGILHRDIKPSNILIDPYGTPRLGDFGLAALPAHGEASVTLEALTPAYAAPEAFEQATPSKRADVWALGATLYSVLTGYAPRQKDDGSPQTVAEIIQSLYRPLPPAPHVAGADPLLDIIWRATAPQAEHRFADGAELHSALLDLRGQLGRPHNVLAGGEVTRMTPGLQQQRFPLAPSGGSGNGQRPPLQPPPLGAPSPAPVAQFASIDGPTRPRRAWPIVLGVLLAVALGGGGVAIGRQLVNGPMQSAEEPPARTDTSKPAGSQTPGTTPSPDPSLSPSPSISPEPSGEGAEYGSLAPAEPICFGGLVSISGYYTYREASCADPHPWEAYRMGSLTDDVASANIDDVLEDPAVQATCTSAALEEYTGLGIDEVDLQVLPPSEAAFATGSRMFYCVASTGSDSAGSFKR